MTKYIVLGLPGTGAPNGGDGILDDFFAHLDPAKFTYRTVPYPAQFGTPMSYADSRAAGMRALNNAVLSVAGPVVVAGYSQGAVIAGDYAVNPNSRVVAAALIADGRRPKDLGIEAGHMEGYGIVDQRPITRVPALWAAAMGDPISSCPAGNPLRTVADVVDYMSLRSPQDAMRWMTDVLAKLQQGKMQPWWTLAHWKDWTGAMAFARGYLFDGRHTTDYVKYGHTKLLADRLSALLP